MIRLDDPLPYAEIDAGSIGVEARMAPRRVVVDAVDPSERLDGTRDEGADRVLGPHVATEAESPSTGTGHALGHGLGALEVDVAHHDGGTLLAQAHGGRAPDVGGTAADEYHLALELAHVGHGRAARSSHIGFADWELRRAAWQHRAVRVHRSFAFVDVSGFTALTELEGDERAVDVLTAFRALLRDICARRGCVTRSGSVTASCSYASTRVRCSRRSSRSTTW